MTTFCEVPTTLLVEGARLTVAATEVAPFANTQSAVVLRGNRAAFLSLANILLYLVASLRDRLDVTSLGFVQAEGVRGLVVEVDDQPGPAQSEGAVRQEADRVYVWRLSAEQLAMTAGTSIHSLGYVTADCKIDHAHIDAGMPTSGTSIYCEVDDDEVGRLGSSVSD